MIVNTVFEKGGDFLILIDLFVDMKTVKALAILRQTSAHRQALLRADGNAPFEAMLSVVKGII